ncbi:MAG: class I SAM-dependent methyltransferase [Gammaproteobacteria bacterium]|nr:MAG: class I SAM-dependent methyltransferase [Gammaproteobacteria bacterium]RKZ71447.1 MAG: class I SAM-dependent methyltransferase [Gammaproteobacteria bacterium]
MNILDEYINTFPTHQNAFDIFKGEWSSLPPLIPTLKGGGKNPLFHDERIVWAEKLLGGFKDCHVLELGPLEGGHTYMLENMGASSIIAIEANSRAYLKCLITKEILNLQRARFLLGDFVSYLKETQDVYDACIASGVLYHMHNPAELIHLIAQKTKKVMIWTHYYDPETNNPDVNVRFSEVMTQEYQGFNHTLYKHPYQNLAAHSTTGFCGGTSHFSMWMSRQDILSCLKYFGFERLEVHFEKPDHPNGPCFCVVGFKA